MEKTYAVTIGIPVFNVEKHLRQTIDSVLVQTFESIEILLCDDCGTDGSIDIIHQYQQNHPRGKDIRIVHQPQNMGIGAARNRMMDEAKGRYFYSLDADDMISSEAIALLYETAQKYDAQIVYGSFERLYVNGEQHRSVQYPYPFKVFSQPNEYAEYVYNVGIQVMNWNYLIDLDVIRKNHLRVTEVGHGYGEDYTFTVDLPTYITRAVLLPDITYQYFIEEPVYEKKRKHVMRRKDMDKALAAIDQKKRRTELSDRPYYAKRCQQLMMYDFYFVREIIARRQEPEPPYTNRELRNIMWHPMTLRQILSSKQERKKNLVFYLLGSMPPCLFVGVMKVITKLTYKN